MKEECKRCSYYTKDNQGNWYKCYGTPHCPASRKRHGTCIKCGVYFMDGENPFVCNKCAEVLKDE